VTQNWILCGVLTWAVLGCEDPLQAVELVSAPRVLGVRVQVDGDPVRAAPHPGETAQVSLLVAAPELQPVFGFALKVCASEAGALGRARCESEPFAKGHGQVGPEPERPTFSFETPAELDPAGRLSVLGIVCPNGVASADASYCEGPDSGTPLELELELARPGDVNMNPALQAGSIGLDDEPWQDLPEEPWRGLPNVEGDCGGLGIPEVSAGSAHRIQLQLDEADRDGLPAAGDAGPGRESLQLSHFTSAGDLSRAFSSLAPEDSNLLRELSWTAPKKPQLVRLWFVVRDLRGGSDFRERAVCVR
jgi:hypothetical protein